MSLELRKRITLRNRKGELTYDSGDIPSNSWVKQFLDCMQSMFGNVAVPRGTVKTTAGIDYQVINDSQWTGADYPLSIDADLDQADWGILLGNGDSTPEANDNFRLDSVIASGVAADQVNYGATNWDAGVTVSGGETSWSFNRTMTNNGAAGVEVKELGVYVRWNSSPLHYVMLIRDLLAPTITIPVGETMTVQYTIKTEV